MNFYIKSCYLSLIFLFCWIFPQQSHEPFVEQKIGKEYFITFNEDYHGKTHGALSFTDSENFASGFHTGIPKENVIFLEPGNIEALKNAIQIKDFLLTLCKPWTLLKLCNTNS